MATHYIMMLGLSATLKARYRGDSVTKLLISLAPARRETKLAIMEQFPNRGYSTVTARPTPAG